MQHWLPWVVQQSLHKQSPTVSPLIRQKKRLFVFWRFCVSLYWRKRREACKYLPSQFWVKWVKCVWGIWCLYERTAPSIENVHPFDFSLTLDSSNFLICDRVSEVVVRYMALISLANCQTRLRLWGVDMICQCLATRDLKQFWAILMQTFH